jgi:FkbM family methyltransferase
VVVTIGGLPLDLDLQFPHERRYALGFQFGYRNPQADIDRYLFKTNLRSGDVVLDVGANIGVTAAEALACGASEVICVEPENNLATRLRALSSLCPKQLFVHHCALGEREGVGELILSTAHNQGHTISPDMAGLFPHLYRGHRQEVTLSTIDMILLHKTSTVWKIDAEGAEAEIIRGARATLARSPPRAILIELYEPFVEEVVGLLPGYRVRRAAISKHDYTLRLLDQVGGSLPDEFCQTSPTYVFTRAV